MRARVRILIVLGSVPEGFQSHRHTGCNLYALINTHTLFPLSFTACLTSSLTSHDRRQTEEGKAKREHDQKQTPFRHRIYTNPLGSIIVQRDPSIGPSSDSRSCYGTLGHTASTE